MKRLKKVLRNERASMQMAILGLLEITMVLTIVAFLSLMFIISSESKKNSANYKEAVTLSSNYDKSSDDNYTICVNGEIMDPESFDVSSLKENNYWFEIDYQTKKIIINSKRKGL